MIAFLEVALRLQSAQILPLNSWKPFPAPGSPDAAIRAVQRWSFISNLQQSCTGLVAISISKHKINNVAHLFSGVLNMTKYSSRLILKIFYFTISASELVLRNKIRFVVRVCNIDNCTVALLVIVLLTISRTCLFFNSPSGYCIAVS